MASKRGNTCNVSLSHFTNKENKDILAYISLSVVRNKYIIRRNVSQA